MNTMNLSDLECISTGVYSPLTGFMDEDNYNSVITNMSLKNGVLWPIPVTLSISKELSDQINVNEQVALEYMDQVIGLITMLYFNIICNTILS